MNINEKELIKQIKASKNQIIWSVQEDVHYITNRHWAVKYEDLPTSVLTTLFAIFAGIPENNSSLQVMYGEPQKADDCVNVRRVMTMDGTYKVGKITNVLVDNGSLLRIIESGGDLLHIRDDYIKICDDLNEQPLCSGPNAPSFFCEGNLLILPVRVVNATYKKIIQDLISL